MDLGAILLLLALLIGVGLYLATPYLRGSRLPLLDESPEVSSLLAERDRLITAIQELDFDFKLGKVPEAAYPLQRTGLMQQGAAVLKRLDELAPQAAAGADATSRLEDAVAAAPRAGHPLADDQIESMLAARRAARHSTSAGFCPNCGRPILASDRFCPNCGQSLH